ncbi:FlgD immunoglobulin-like domain containing protein [Candidatus Latescibacterota bacterium]
MALALLIGTVAAPATASLPTFENQTPTGFSLQDGTTRTRFVEGQEVSVRVDLNQAATPTYPVIGHFHTLERSEALETEDVDGLRADVAITPEGVLHVAWISQEVVLPVTTPAYYVRYARSNDGGSSFTEPVSVSGSLRFDILTVDGGGPSFSTLDLELDSRGNPRVVYAFSHSADGNTAKFAGNPDNIYLNYSETGGANWLPGNNAVVVNDLETAGNTEGRTTAFPRMAIDQRDNIYITYVRGSTAGGGTDDIMLAKVNRETSPFSMYEVGSEGTLGSAGGVRISPDGDRQTGPDIAVGRGDVLHLIYYNEADTDIEHKTLLADLWDRVNPSGWDQLLDGADVDQFVPTTGGNPALNANVSFYFPTVVVDQQRTPDRIYAIYKYGDATYETIFYNHYLYDNATGAGAGWVTAQAAPVWSTANTTVFGSGDPSYNVEQDWTVVDRVSAVVDDRRPDLGEIHIVFTAGYSSTTDGATGKEDVYYGHYNGVTWTLPEKVADERSDWDGTEDGIADLDKFLSAPSIAKRPGDANLYMVFAGGTQEGLGVRGATDANQHAYFKVIGRDYTWEDESIPVGGYQYDLSYIPTNPHDATADIADQAVYVHVADNLTGAGLGATGKAGDGFLAGDWEYVGTSLQDNDKYFEGLDNEDGSAGRPEWGDDGDKVGLLVKLNILGSDSATNLQAVTGSTASDGGTGLNFARTVRVAQEPPVSLKIKDFFLLGADIDIVDANTAPTVRIRQPDGQSDTASTSYVIRYDLQDPDNDMASLDLEAALYFSPHSDLGTVQDVRIFGTLIADQNDDPAVFGAGTGDFSEGRNQTYTWDNPPGPLKAMLFASILQVPSGDYFIYLVADDGENPPVFARSPGSLAIRHRPTVQYVDPAGLDTVDTGQRSGMYANPYDLDFYVRDYDGQGGTQVSLFYSAVSGLTSVSVSGSYPNQAFVLGKSSDGVRAVHIENSDTLTSADTEFSWDVTDSVSIDGDSSIVAEGTYFLYVVASDGASVSVGQSEGQLLVKHSPSFVFYEPPKDTRRAINTGSQPVYTVQWQKGPGDGDFDHDASIDLYFTTDNPASINYEDDPDSLQRDSDTRVLVAGLTEDDDGEEDMYVWSLRSPPEQVPEDGQEVWLYALIRDPRGNETVALGGGLTVYHAPYINLMSADLGALTTFDKSDVLRLTWDDYLVDDGLDTDDAYIRLYASESPSAFASPQDLDVAVDGLTTFLINSTDGTGNTAVTIRESDADFYDWDTGLFGNAGTNYDIYAAIGTDATFYDNTAGGVSKSASPLNIQGSTSKPEVGMYPSDVEVAVGDTLTFDVMVQYPEPINLVQIVIEINDIDFSVRDQSTQSGKQPFIDLGNVFPGATAIENRLVSNGVNQLRFAKSTFSGQVVGSPTQPEAVARFQLVALGTLGGAPSVIFSGGQTGTVLGLVGIAEPLSESGGLDVTPPQLTRQARGEITAIVELEGRTIPPAASDYTTLLDVHLRQVGSTLDITDRTFIEANDDFIPPLGTVDSVEIQIASTGECTLRSVPAGRYVLTVKDTSHLSGRTDTITVRNGESIAIDAADGSGFYGSDLRGDPTSLLPSSGRRLIAGDVSEDNEINEDDVNLIIAAWGGDAGKPYFAQADINNDEVVGAPDLTVTTSNFGNSQGFGAPPVYKPVTVAGGGGSGSRRRAANDRASLSLKPLFDTSRPPETGEVIGVELAASDLDDLAGYELEVSYDEGVLRLVPERTESGAIFADNPHGSVFQARAADGVLQVISSRIGKAWSAEGSGSLARMWFEVLDSGVESAIEPGEGVLLSPQYRPTEARWSQSLAGLFLPVEPALDPNYPNPFNPSTTIPFALPAAQHVRVEIYNMLGQRVRILMSGLVQPGFHSLVWNGRDDGGHQVGAGLYVSLLETPDFRQTRKMMLVK